MASFGSGLSRSAFLPARGGPARSLPFVLDGVPCPCRPQVALLSRSFAFILLVYMFAGFAYQGGLTFLPRFVGAGFFALALALGAIGQVLSGRLADRRRFERILFALSAAAAAILVLLAVLPLGGPFIAAALVFGFLLFSLEPLQNTLVTR